MPLRRSDASTSPIEDSDCAPATLAHRHSRAFQTTRVMEGEVVTNRQRCRARQCALQPPELTLTTPSSNSYRNEVVVSTVSNALPGDSPLIEPCKRVSSATSCACSSIKLKRRPVSRAAHCKNSM